MSKTSAIGCDQSIFKTAVVDKNALLNREWYYKKCRAIPRDVLELILNYLKHIKEYCLEQMCIIVDLIRVRTNKPIYLSIMLELLRLHTSEPSVLIGILQKRLGQNLDNFVAFYTEQYNNDIKILNDKYTKEQETNIMDNEADIASINEYVKFMNPNELKKFGCNIISSWNPKTNGQTLEIDDVKPDCMYYFLLENNYIDPIKIKYYTPNLNPLLEIYKLNMYGVSVLESLFHKCIKDIGGISTYLEYSEPKKESYHDDCSSSS